jgi:dihydrofolate synthase/folylpolyglutamate synthase
MTRALRARGFFMTNTFEQYHAASSRMDALIEMTPSPTDASREAVQERAEFRMGRLRRFLARLGNPHRGYPIVHIGGTSGKGSTSTTLAGILTAAGYRTGLHTSPYLQTPLEKLQINGDLVSADGFIELVETFFAEHDTWIADGEEPLTYGEGWGALTWLFFRHEQVDIAVVEVGAGGRYDLTNILDPTLSVITSVGIDHTQTLGTTVEQIAWHKAGIIKPGIPALSAVPDPAAQAIIEAESREVGASLSRLNLATDIVEIATGPDGTSWTDRRSGERHRMRMCGSFQAHNGQTAVDAVRILRQGGMTIGDDAIERGLQRARIPGRAEFVSNGVTVLLDGAHNPEKLAALAADIPDLFPRREGGRRIGVVGLLDAKKGDEMLRALVPVVDALVLTSPQVLGKEAKAAETVERLAEEAGFGGEIVIEPEPRQALDRALVMANGALDQVLVTGSLYLIGNVRERWYPEPDIVAQRTPWPTR